MSEGVIMSLNEKDKELIYDFMESVYGLKDTKTIFLDTLKLFSQGRGIAGDGFWVTIDFFEANKMDEYDIEYLGGRKFDGVVFDICFDTGEPPTTFLSYQEFYDILCEYVEKAIKDKGSAFQDEARKYLCLFKERYNLR